MAEWLTLFHSPTMKLKRNKVTKRIFLFFWHSVFAATIMINKLSVMFSKCLWMAFFKVSSFWDAALSQQLLSVEIQKLLKPVWRVFQRPFRREQQVTNNRSSFLSDRVQACDLTCWWSWGSRRGRWPGPSWWFRPPWTRGMNLWWLWLDSSGALSDAAPVIIWRLALMLQKLTWTTMYTQTLGSNFIYYNVQALNNRMTKVELQSSEWLRRKNLGSANKKGDSWALKNVWQ